MEDRTLHVGVLLAAHIIFLSAGALRILRGERKHLVRSQGSWFVRYYPPLVWVPFLIAYFFPLPVDLPLAVRFAGSRSRSHRRCSRPGRCGRSVRATGSEWISSRA